MQAIDSMLLVLETYDQPSQLNEGLLLVNQYKDTILFYADSFNLVFVRALSIEADLLEASNEYDELIVTTTHIVNLLITLDEKENNLFVKNTARLAYWSFRKDQYNEATHWAMQCIAMCEKMEEPDTASYILALTSAGLTKLYSSSTIDAEPLLLKALELSDSSCLHCGNRLRSLTSGLAQLYLEKGNALEAEKYALEAVNSENKEDTLMYVAALGNLGVFYQKTFNYAKAEESFIASIQLLKAKGINSLQESELTLYYNAIYNLAATYDNIGKYEEALLLLSELEPYCNSSKGSFQACGSVLNMKASLYSKLDLLPEAETTIELQKAYILKTIGSKNNIYYVEALLCQANFYYKPELYAKYIPLVEEATRILTPLVTNSSPEYLGVLANLGSVYLETGDTLRADSVHKIILTAIDSIDASDFISYYNLIGALAGYYHREMYAELGSRFYLLLIKILPRIYFNTIDFYSESAFLQQKFDLVSQIYNFQSFLYSTPKDSSLYGANYNMALLLKSTYLEKRLALQQQINLSDDASRLRFSAWQDAQKELFAAYTSETKDRKQIQRLESISDSVEVLLFRKLPNINEITKGMSWQDIANGLAADEAAIEFCRVLFIDSVHQENVHYSVSILRAGSAYPVYIPMCVEKDLKAILTIEGRDKKAAINSLYSFEFKGSQLFKEIIAPILPHIKGCKRIYISPSGLLHQINFSAIPINANETLDQIAEIHVVTSTREILSRMDETSSATIETSTASVFGGLFYDELTITPHAFDSLAAIPYRGVEEEFSLDSTKNMSSWPYLTFTKKETEKISSLLSMFDYNVQLFQGASGSEAEFKRIGALTNSSSPTILHLSTHGYFFPPPSGSDLTESVEKRYSFITHDHPMLRSGLIMAGANPYWLKEKVAQNEEDGILTSYEISQMDLSDTKLVVLSACETGLGVVNTVEGVYGLQRAFKIAGAKQIISSLWQVPDFQTYELMDLFYKGYLEEKLSPGEALRLARDKMRKKRYEPFYWAGFVLLE